MKSSDIKEEQELSRRGFVKLGAGGVAALGIAGLSACSGGTKNASQGTDKKPQAAAPVKTHTVTDMKGAKVEIPNEITSIADIWHAHNQVTLMLGAADKLVGTTEIIKKTDWFVKVYPRIKDVTTLVTGGGKAAVLNSEELIKLKPSVVFGASDADIKTARDNGLVAVNCEFQNFEGMRKSVLLTGDVLGGEAKTRAQKWAKLLDANLDRIAAKTHKLKKEDKPKVLHIANLEKLTIDGKTSIVNEWIEQAGGVNAIDEGKNLMQITLEAIVKADPDVIIIGGNGNVQSVQTLMADKKWSGIKAVKNHTVYANPLGTFPWDRYSGEEALQLLWAAAKLHPQLFRDLDMVKETKAFYKDFYNFTLSDDQAKQILTAKKPE